MVCIQQLIYPYIYIYTYHNSTHYLGCRRFGGVMKNLMGKEVDNGRDTGLLWGLDQRGLL